MMPKTCPVTALERYVRMADVNLSNPSGSFLFRGLVKIKGGYKLRSSGGFSYTRARELVLDALEGIGMDRSKFGLHVRPMLRWGFCCGECWRTRSLLYEAWKVEE